METNKNKGELEALLAVKLKEGVAKFTEKKS